MAPTLFVSYSHSDNAEHRWAERLNTFFDAVKDTLPVDVWADTRMGAGEKWRAEIASAISQAAAAVLLVGPGFLASQFIKDHELPDLLRAKDAGALRLYPLVVAFSPWSHSLLEPYQAFNDPNAPLEAMTPAEQNRWLNRLVVAIADEMRSVQVLPAKSAPPTNTLRTAIAAIRDSLEATRTAFVMQARRRNQLVATMQSRLSLTELPEFEQLFFRYFDRMDEGEQFEFAQIRAITEGLLHDNNRKILDTIEATPAVRDELPILSALRLHLLVWLNKYDRVFAKSARMSVLYVGVEDGVPFPLGVDEVVAEWLVQNK